MKEESSDKKSPYMQQLDQIAAGSEGSAERVGEDVRRISERLPRMTDVNTISGIEDDPTLKPKINLVVSLLVLSIIKRMAFATRASVTAILISVAEKLFGALNREYPDSIKAYLEDKVSGEDELTKFLRQAAEKLQGLIPVYLDVEGRFVFLYGDKAFYLDGDEVPMSTKTVHSSGAVLELYLRSGAQLLLHLDEGMREEVECDVDKTWDISDLPDKFADDLKLLDRNLSIYLENGTLPPPPFPVEPYTCDHRPAVVTHSGFVFTHTGDPASSGVLDAHGRMVMVSNGAVKLVKQESPRSHDLTGSSEMDDTNFEFFNDDTETPPKEYIGRTVDAVFVRVTFDHELGQFTGSPGAEVLETWEWDTGVAVCEDNGDVVPDPTSDDLTEREREEAILNITKDEEEQLRAIAARVAKEEEEQRKKAENERLRREKEAEQAHIQSLRQKAQEARNEDEAVRRLQEGVEEDASGSTSVAASTPQPSPEGDDQTAKADQTDTQGDGTVVLPPPPFNPPSLSNPDLEAGTSRMPTKVLNPGQQPADHSSTSQAGAYPDEKQKGIAMSDSHIIGGLVRVYPTESEGSFQFTRGPDTELLPLDFSEFLSMDGEPIKGACTTTYGMMITENDETIAVAVRKQLLSDHLPESSDDYEYYMLDVEANKLPQTQASPTGIHDKNSSDGSSESSQSQGDINMNQLPPAQPPAEHPTSEQPPAQLPAEQSAPSKSAQSQPPVEQPVMVKVEGKLDGENTSTSEVPLNRLQDRHGNPVTLSDDQNTLLDHQNNPITNVQFNEGGGVTIPVRMVTDDNGDQPPASGNFLSNSWDWFKSLHGGVRIVSVLALLALIGGGAWLMFKGDTPKDDDTKLIVNWDHNDDTRRALAEKYKNLKPGDEFPQHLFLTGELRLPGVDAPQFITNENIKDVIQFMKATDHGVWNEETRSIRVQYQLNHGHLSKFDEGVEGTAHPVYHMRVGFGGIKWHKPNPNQRAAVSVNEMYARVAPDGFVEFVLELTPSQAYWDHLEPLRTKDPKAYREALPKVIGTWNGPKLDDMLSN